MIEALSSDESFPVEEAPIPSYPLVLFLWRTLTNIFMCFEIFLIFLNHLEM